MLGKLTKYLFLPLALVLGLFALYTWASLQWVYSSGERAGYIQKFSHKGYLCKTWEGEMVLVSMPGTQAEKFFFTVRDDKLVSQINASVGQRVRVEYEEHKGIPSSCFGETPHFITKVQVIPERGNPLGNNGNYYNNPVQ